MRSILILIASAAIAGPAFAQSSAQLEQIMRADADRNGAVTRQELVAWRAAQFDRIDRNQDGFITEADRPTHAIARRALPIDPAELAAAFDADSDGRVSQAEFANGPTPVFDNADGDANGVVTRAEVQSVRTKLAQ